MLALNIILAVAAALVLVPIMVFALECVLASLRGKTKRDGSSSASAPRPRVAVLIPAYNEAAGIAATVSAVVAQLAPGDRVIVVADNCEDDTATIARNAGAAVFERADPLHRGKGFALDFGLQQLAADPPGIVFVIDADCRLVEDTINRIAREVAARDLPIQASNLLEPPPNPGLRDAISAFAFLVKNLVRPLGLDAFGLPCLLMGTGMAIPWALMKDAHLASANIVEDMQLGIDLAIAGYPARLCIQAGVRGTLGKGTGAMAQRRRWEHGHLRTLLTQVPRLIFQGLRQARLDLLAMAVDLAIPPLSLLVLTWAMLTAGCTALWIAGGAPWPFAIVAGGGFCLLVGVLAAWARFGRRLLPLRCLVAAPIYAVCKLPLYLGFIFKREKAWIRSERSGA